MKTPLLITPLLFVAITGHALADYTIEERIEHNDSPSQTAIIRLKGDKARCDMGPMSTVANGNDITMLMHAQKIAMKLPTAAINATKSDSNSGPRQVLQPTGRKEKINGFDTEEFVHDNPSLKATTHLWIAKNFPDQAEIMKMLKSFVSPAMQQMTQAIRGVSPDDYPGMPIRTEVESHLMGKPSKTVVTLVSVKKESIDDAVFSIPADYHSAGPKDE
jgi:hypothetical protein